MAAAKSRPDTAPVFVAFDLETTGFAPEQEDITEVAGVKFTLSGEVLSSFQQLARPSCRIPPIVRKKTGITAEMVADAPASWEVVQSFAQWVGSDAVLVAHNASFDCRFLLAAYERNSAELPSWRVVDTLPLARRVVPEGGKRGLGDILQHLGETKPENLHRAMADADATKRVFLAAVGSYKNTRASIKRRVTPFMDLARPLATDRQLNYLRDLGAPAKALEGLTKRQASALLDQYIERAREAEAERAESGGRWSVTVPAERKGGCFSVLLLVFVVSALAWLW